MIPMSDGEMPAAISRCTCSITTLASPSFHCELRIGVHMQQRLAGGGAMSPGWRVWKGTAPGCTTAASLLGQSTS